MIMEPSFGESVTLEDKILFLYLLARMPEKRISKIESMKMTFFVKAKAYEKKELIFRLKFLRERRGPVAPHIYDIGKEFNINLIALNQYIQGPTMPYECLVLNDEASVLLDEIEVIADNIPWPFDEIDEVVKKYGNLSWNERQKEIYNIVVNGRRVRDYKLKESFEMPSLKTWKNFSIPTHYRNFLEKMFDQKKRSEFSKISDQSYCLLMSQKALKKTWMTDEEDETWRDI